MKLINAKLNEEYIVVDIDKEDKAALKKICSLGILPGLTLKVVQKKPMTIFEVFHSRFAIDNHLAEKIIVDKLNAVK